MTVAQLIEALKVLPQNRRVVVDCNSDYMELEDVSQIALVDRGGHLSIARSYRPEDKLREEDFIYLG